MIVVVDIRRPAGLGVDATLQLEAFLEHAQTLVSHCGALGRAGAVETPFGLIVPASSIHGKVVQVVCKGRPVCSADLSSMRLVDVEENVYGDGFGWGFLTDATLTATRIRGLSKKIVLLTTDLMLAGENFKLDVQRFFSDAARALGTESSGVSISLVFVEVAGSCSSSNDTLSTPDSFLAWDRLQRLRDDTNNGVFMLDLICNTPEMFNSQLRCWLRESSPRQSGALCLPATETFSGVVVEVEILPYLLDDYGLVNHRSSPPLHCGFSSIEVLQGIDLGTLDQGLCRGNPLLCMPSSQVRGTLQHSQANSKLFAAVCAELNDRDMGLLLAVRHPSTSLQAPVGPSTVEAKLSQFADRALLSRLATKEDVLNEASAPTLGCIDREGCSVERVAACASIDMLSKGTYNPLRHSSGLLEFLSAQENRSNSSIGPAKGPRGGSTKVASNRRVEISNDRRSNKSSLKSAIIKSTGGGSYMIRSKGPHQQQKSRNSSRRSLSTQPTSAMLQTAVNMTNAMRGTPVSMQARLDDKLPLNAQKPERREVTLRYGQVLPSTSSTGHNGQLHGTTAPQPQGKSGSGSSKNSCIESMNIKHSAPGGPSKVEGGGSQWA